MKTIFWSLAILAMLVPAGTAAQMETPTPAKPKVEVIAHRGASGPAPENTLAAFKLARELGADWFELDCMPCKTGEVVVMHDDTVDRTTDGTGRVDALTLEELRKLDAGSWKGEEYAHERVPTLAEAVRLADEKTGCYIEIKPAANELTLLSLLARDKLARDEAFDKAFLASVDSSSNAAIARAVVKVVRAEKKEAHAVIQSFSPVVCAVIAIEAPELRVELLGSGKKADDWEGYWRWALLFDFAGVNTSHTALTEVRLDVLRTAGKRCAVYTVNRRHDMKRLAGWGVTGIITDNPNVCIEELKLLGLR